MIPNMPTIILGLCMVVSMRYNRPKLPFKIYIQAAQIYPYMIGIEPTIIELVSILLNQRINPLCQPGITELSARFRFIISGL